MPGDTPRQDSADRLNGPLLVVVIAATALGIFCTFLLSYLSPTPVSEFVTQHVPGDVLVLWLAMAVYTDLKEQKLRNVLTLPLSALGLLYHLLQGDPLFAVYGLLAAFALHFTLWVFGVERAGDAKLMMGIGAFVGWSEMLEISLWTLILLVPVGLVILWIRGRLGNLVEAARWTYHKALGVPVGERPQGTLMAYAAVIASAVVVARFVSWPSSLWT